MYADLEAVVITYLTGTAGVADISVEMPNVPALPFVLVARITGGDDYITDRGVVYIETFAADRQTSSDLARLIHHRMLKLRHTYVGGVPVGHVETVNGPFWSNYQDENMERHIASYVIHSAYTATHL